MEGSSILQVKHGDDPAPLLSVTGFILSSFFFTDEAAPFVLVHKGISRVSVGGFLELLKDSGPGCPVV